MLESANSWDPELLVIAWSLSDTLHILWKCAFKTDPFLAEVEDILRKGVGHDHWIAPVDCLEREGQLVYGKSAYISAFNALRLYLIVLHYDRSLVGQYRQAKIQALLKREYFWPSIQRDIDQFVWNCNTADDRRQGDMCPTNSWTRYWSSNETEKISLWTSSLDYLIQTASILFGWLSIDCLRCNTLYPAKMTSIQYGSHTCLSDTSLASTDSRITSSLTEAPSSNQYSRISGLADT